MKRFLVSVLAIVALSACTTRHADVGKVLNLVLGDDVKTLDPASAYDSVSLTVMPLALESLYQYKYTKLPLELEPLIAEAMPVISKDLKTFTITLKKGVMFQDDAAFPGGKGRELKAQDFIYAWKRMLLPNIQSPGTWMFDGKVVGWDDYRKRLTENRADAEKILDEPVAGLLATDNYTIQIKLLQPYPQLIHVLAMGFGAPVAKEVIAKYGQEGLNERMVGTGPFKLVQFTKGSKIILERNTGFRGEAYPSDGDEDAKASGLLQAAGLKLPFIDKITFNVIKEDQPAWLQFRKGNLDAAGVPKDSFTSAIDAGDLRPELKTQGVKLRKAEEAVSWYLNFNMKDKLVGTNADLRKAISMAINRDEFIEKFLNGRGVKATSIVPRVIAGFTGRTEVVNDFNPAMAKEYLAKAGYPGGKGLPVIKYDLRGPSTTARQQAEYFKKLLADIGVNIDIVVNTFPAYLEKEKNGNLQFFMGGWNADYPDAENFLFLLSSKNVAPGPNASNYINPAFDKLYEQMAKMTPSKERSAIIRKAEEIVFNDGVWSMLYYPVRFNLYHGWLKNFRPNAQILNDVKYLDIDEAKKKELQKSL
jgi:oligopeptide transport system substrate-binding protein